MYKAKVKWNGDHYSAGFEVKGSKIEKREYGRLLGFSTTSRFQNSHSTETEEKSVSRLMRALSSECNVKKNMKYKIKQIKDVENCEYAFRHFNWVKDKINLKDYEVVYEGELDYPEIPNVLEELFEIFNIRHPEDFKGRSMSVSDIVEVDGDNYYCDAVGWVKFK